MNANFSWLIFRIAVIFVTPIIGGSISDAAAGGCDNAPLPSIEIQILKSDIQQAYDISVADIQRLSRSTGKQPFWPGLGASSADIAYAIAINENAAKEVSGSYCAVPASVHIMISLKNRVIHLARQLKENPCLERIQKERLLKLAHDDERAFEEFPIEAEVRNLLGQLHPSRAESEIAARAQITKEVQKQIQVVLDKVQKYKAEIDRRENLPEEIDRLRHDVKSGKACRSPI